MMQTGSASIWRRCLIVGSGEQYPKEASAQKAVAALRADINAENPRTSLTPISVQMLIEDSGKRTGLELQQNTKDAGHL
jgi:hypothetical protein